MVLLPPSDELLGPRLPFLLGRRRVLARATGRLSAGTEQGPDVERARSGRTLEGMHSNNYTPADILEMLKKAADAMKTDWPASLKTIAVNRVEYTPAAFAAKLLDLAAPYQRAADLAIAHAAAVQDRDGVDAQTRDFLALFYQALPAYVGAIEAEKFGKKAPKARRQPTGEEQVITAEKRRATRKARNTMGKRQKVATNFVEQFPAVELRAVA
jgi:hypothetical protein